MSIKKADGMVKRQNKQLQTKAANIPCELRAKVCDLLENDSRLITEARSPQIAKFNKQYL